MIERESAAAELIRAARELDRLGLSPAHSGNVSARVGDVILISPTGTSLRELDAEHLATIDLDGIQLDGPPPSKEVPLHLAWYRRADSVRAVVHLHSPFAVAQSCRPPWSVDAALPPITPYYVMRVGRTPLIPYARPGSARLGDLISRQPGEIRSALLQNHGSVVANNTVDGAVEAAVELEEAARIVTLLGDQISPLTAEQVEELVQVFGAPWRIDGAKRGASR